MLLRLLLINIDLKVLAEQLLLLLVVKNLNVFIVVSVIAVLHTFSFDQRFIEKELEFALSALLIYLRLIWRIFSLLRIRHFGPPKVMLGQLKVWSLNL